jgi:hypothetical protein
MTAPLDPTLMSWRSSPTQEVDRQLAASDPFGGHPISGLLALVRSLRSGYGRAMRNHGLGIGAMIGIGAAIGVLLMPSFGPLALVVGAALGVVFGAAFEAQRTAR